MGGLSLWHWLVVAVLVFGMVVPAAMICRRAGRSRAWATLTVFPIGIIVWLWWLALADWREGAR